jgi:archaellum component FlaG (FlaF/FlaG flagellin family)
MKHMIRLFVSLLVPALMLAFATATPAMKHEMAQDKAKAAHKATNSTKVLHEDDRVRVVENTTKPGEVGPSVMRGKRVVRYLQGGTQERNYPDGKKEKVERKTGEVLVAGPDTQAYFIKNIGNTTIVSYVVQIKGAK